MSEQKYLIKRVRRNFQGQARDDYHATVTRLSDGKQAIFISAYKRLLNWKIRPKGIERTFRSIDRYERKLKDEEVEYFQ